MRRSEVFRQLIRTIGNDARIQKVGTGWPGIAEFQLDEGPVQVAIHVGPIGLSHRKRDHVERRFQNPGQGRPMQRVDGMPSLLIGVWAVDQLVDVVRPVIVVMEATDHRFNQSTRQSYFVPLHSLVEGATTGWSEHRNEVREHILVMWPELLAAYVSLWCNDAVSEASDMPVMLAASGVSEAASREEYLEAVGRAQKQAWRVVRDSKFARLVKDAYGGRCGLCGLDYGLVEAAHIHPVSAPGASDEVNNGVCLCPNHHRAFDRHLLWIAPHSLDVRVHPQLREFADSYTGRRRFVQSTSTKLDAPLDPACRPASQCLALRYSFFHREYSWALGGQP